MITVEDWVMTNQKRSLFEQLLKERDEALAKLETSNWLDNNMFVKAADLTDPKKLGALLFMAANDCISLEKKMKSVEAKAEAYREIAIRFKSSTGGHTDYIDEDAQRILDQRKNGKGEE